MLMMNNGAANSVAPSPRSWGNRTRVYPSSVTLMTGRSRIYPTSAEREQTEYVAPLIAPHPVLQEQGDFRDRRESDCRDETRADRPRRRILPCNLCRHSWSSEG